jgi:hypothetical protein
MVIKDSILGKAWEAQLAMLVTGKKCWAGFVKKWLFHNQSQKVTSFLPQFQPSLETTPQLATTRVFQVGIIQPLLGTIPKITHTHPTRLARVRGWAENQIPWCNAHNVRVGAQEVGAQPLLVFPTQC